MNKFDDYTALRTFRDFLTQYNQVSENCFSRCINELSRRDLSKEEAACVDMCTKKHVNVNHKVMQVYMEVQPMMMNKRVEEMNKQAVEEIGKASVEASTVPDKPAIEDPNKEVKTLDSQPSNQNAVTVAT